MRPEELRQGRPTRPDDDRFYGGRARLDGGGDRKHLPTGQALLARAAHRRTGCTTDDAARLQSGTPSEGERYPVAEASQLRHSRMSTASTGRLGGSRRYCLLIDEQPEGPLGLLSRPEHPRPSPEAHPPEPASSRLRNGRRGRSRQAARGRSRRGGVCASASASRRRPSKASRHQGRIQSARVGRPSWSVVASLATSAVRTCSLIASSSCTRGSVRLIPHAGLRRHHEVVAMQALILCVHQVTVVLPHSVSSAG